MLDRRYEAVARCTCPVRSTVISTRRLGDALFGDVRSGLLHAQALGTAALLNLIVQFLPKGHVEKSKFAAGIQDALNDFYATGGRRLRETSLHPGASFSAPNQGRKRCAKWH
jgi:hypothetical protein